MNFVNLLKLFCMPCLKLVSSFPNKCSSSTRASNLSKPLPVPLAYSEYRTDDSKADIDSPILIIHGLLGSRNNWNTMSKNISVITNRKVVALDLRNHGDSPHTAEFSYDHLSADLKSLISKLGVESGKASIVGHSIGGRIAMALALENPEMIRDLVVVDVSPLGAPPGVNYVPRLLNALDSVSLTPGQTLSAARREAGEQMKKYIRGERLRNFLLTNLIVDESTNHFVWKINVQSLKKNFSSLLDFPKFSNIYSRPCLFVSGENSQYLKKEDEIEIKKLFPGASFEYVTGAGHLIHSDKPDIFIDLVCKFLNKNLTLH